MFVKQDTTDDYLVAGRGMHPALAALSAVSTWNSGYMFIGFIGFIFIQGYSGLWIGLVSTSARPSLDLIYKFIQKEGTSEACVRCPSCQNGRCTRSQTCRRALRLSSRFTPRLNSWLVAWRGTMLGWSEVMGILIGFSRVAYCYAGGIRASIWTDAAQSRVMIVGSSILCYVAVAEVGGLSGLHGLEGHRPGHGEPVSG